MTAPTDPTQRAEALQKQFQEDGMNRFFAMAEAHLQQAETVGTEMQNTAQGIQAQLNAHLQGASQAANSNTFEGPTFRVFQHDQSGRRMVLRNTEKLADYTAVEIPGASPQTPTVTERFALALACVNQSLSARAMNVAAATSESDGATPPTGLLAEIRGLRKALDDARARSLEAAYQLDPKPFPRHPTHG